MRYLKEAVEKQGDYNKDLCMVTRLASGYVGMRKRADVLWQALPFMCAHACAKLRKLRRVMNMAYLWRAGPCHELWCVYPGSDLRMLAGYAEAAPGC